MPEAEIVYDPNLPMAFVGGAVVPTGKKPVSATEIMEGLRTSLVKEYSGSHPNRIGLTRAEAINDALTEKAADGDLEATKIIFDRTMGKPVQQVQSLTVTTSLKDFLNGLIAANARRANDPFAPLG